MNTDLGFISDVITFGLRVAAVVITLFFVIPLQRNQAKVKDSLAKLRNRLLYFGIISLLLNLVSVILVFSRIGFSNEISVAITSIFSIPIGILFLALAYLGYKVYHEQYKE